MSRRKEEINILRQYLKEVLTGFKSLNAMGKDRALGNLRWGDYTLSQKNRGILTDIEEEESKIVQDMTKLPSASCIYVTRSDGKILAVSRKDDPNDFGMPGGQVDPGEEPDLAAIRELKEETGLDINDVKLIYESEDDAGYFVRVYTGKITGKIQTEESGVVKWVEPEILIRGTFRKFNEKFLKSIFKLL